jgi:hypothetical protein
MIGSANGLSVLKARGSITEKKVSAGTSRPYFLLWPDQIKGGTIGAKGSTLSLGLDHTGDLLRKPLY